MHAGALTNDQEHPYFETITLPEITDNSGRGTVSRFGGPHLISLSQCVVDPYLQGMYFPLGVAFGIH
jgi:hypothetical protein